MPNEYRDQVRANSIKEFESILLQNQGLYVPPSCQSIVYSFRNQVQIDDFGNLLSTSTIISEMFLDHEQGDNGVPSHPILCVASNFLLPWIIPKYHLAIGSI
jgi:hypothetical protein